MSASKVQGSNVTLLVFNIDGTYTIYCGQSVDINVVTNMYPSSNIQSGGFQTFTAGKTTWDISFAGLIFIKDNTDGNFVAFDFLTEQARKTGFDLYVVFTNDQENTATFSGHGYPFQNQLSGTVGQLSKFNTKFQGSGAFNLNQNIPQQKDTDVKAYYYTATGAEPDTFTDSLLIGRIILVVMRPLPLEIITSGAPNALQVLYTSSSGTFKFGSVFNQGEKITILYI